MILYILLTTRLLLFVDARIRKVFSVPAKPPLWRCSMIISGLGYFVAHLGGERVSDHELGESTQFESQLPYSALDCTAAASRALGELHAAGVDFQGAVVLLDGSHDWLTAALPRRSVLPRVITQVKADRDCAVVAAASVLAKVHRDRLMIAAHEEAPEFGWASNKGYASAAHYAAVEARGPHPLHRRSWLREPTLDVAVESPGA